MEYEIINFSEILNIPGVWVELYFDNVNNKVIIYNGINFNYEVIRTLEIKDFIEEYGDTLLFCAGKYNVSWRNVGYTLKGYKEYDYRNFIKTLVCS